MERGKEASHATALPSWNEGKSKEAIVAFVRRVSEPGSPDFVAVDERIAVFDNDGTLWPEKPLVVQLAYTLERLGELARADPDLQTKQPYKSAFDHDFSWLNQAIVKHYNGDDADFAVLGRALPTAFAGLTIEDYFEAVKAFFRVSDHPTLKRPYSTIGYQPMTELIDYLAAHGFTVYITSGGDRDFMRGIARELYGIPPERVIGSSLKLEFREVEDRVEVLYKGEMDFLDDGVEKPIRIWSRIGRRPLFAAGNANGDIPMLRFANVPNRPSFRLLVHHDDAEREFAYDDGADAALQHAAKHAWTVVSMRDDWKTVFPSLPPVSIHSNAEPEQQEAAP
ncbi:MAG: HAD family hydrolase [Thermomicrobiales bacterium]